MSYEDIDLNDLRLRVAVAELDDLVRDAYHDASFAVFRGEDPDGIYLCVTLDIDDTDEIFDVVADRLYDIQVEQGLPLYFVTTPSLERVAAQLRDRPQGYQPIAVPPRP